MFKDRISLYISSLTVCLILSVSLCLNANGQFLEESRADLATADFGVTGEGVIISVFDRGIDYEHDDFRNDDGSTRILAILDLSDNSGANDPDNPVGSGTVYTEDEINTALTSGTPLATRDAVGHGTLTAGIAGGNGRASNGTWTGVAPNAKFIIVKFTSEGTAAHDGEPAESAFFFSDLIDESLDFVLGMAEEEGMPIVVTTNFGSIQAPSDGSSTYARAIDERFGPSYPGRVFISGSSDDGGKDNHASGTIGLNQTIDLLVRKGNTGNLRVDLWYDEADRFDVEVVTPTNTYGPFLAPTSPTSTSDGSGTGFVLYQRGRDIDFFGSTSNKREILIDINGAVGDYIIRLTGTSVSNGLFHALMNPSTIFSATENRFESFVVPGYTIWDGAASLYTIVPNSYVHNPTWLDINGVSRTHPGNDVDLGDLWPGSGIGPTLDGRDGITISAPGNTNIGPVAPNSYFASLPFALAQGGNGDYGVLAFVSGANPVLTGAIALMFEVDPTLNGVEVSDILKSTGRQDAFTGTTPNPIWGGGKLDVRAAVEEVTSRVGVEDFEWSTTADFELDVFPNPVSTTATVRMKVTNGGPVTLSLYDVLGRRVLSVHNTSTELGIRDQEIDTSTLTNGIYLARGVSGEVSATQMIVVNR